MSHWSVSIREGTRADLPPFRYAVAHRFYAFGRSATILMSRASRRRARQHLDSLDHPKPHPLPIQVAGIQQRIRPHVGFNTGRLLTTIPLRSRFCGIIRLDIGAFALSIIVRSPMPWDLGLPLFVVLATVLVMGFIYFGARNLLFKSRKEDKTDEIPEGNSED